MNRPTMLKLVQNRTALMLMSSLVILLGLLAGILVDANLRQKSLIEPIDASAQITATPEISPSPTPSPTPIVIKPDFTHLTADQPIPILMYHYIRDHRKQNDKMGSNLSVSPATFTKQLETLKQAGYTAVTFNDLLTKEIPAKPIILTFDDGYADAYIAAFPRLKEQGMTGIFYLVSNFLDKSQYITSQAAQEMAAAGMEIGSHTIDHRDLGRMSSVQQEQQLTESKQKLEALIGKPITAFCYPAGRYNQQTISLMKKVGYTTATTTKHGVSFGRHFTSQPFELKRIRVTNHTDILKAIQ